MLVRPSAYRVDLGFDSVDLLLDLVDGTNECIDYVVAESKLADNFLIGSKNSHEGIKQPVAVNIFVVFHAFDPLENVVRMLTVIEAEAQYARREYNKIKRVRAAWLF